LSAGAAIRVAGLEKRYGATTAVDGISFEVEPGQVFCLLGPNGAGKTTTIECLEGYRKPDGGEIRVLGMDPRVDESALRRRIGVQLQEASLPARLRVWEILQLFSVLYERPAVPWDLLERLGLEAKRDTYFDKLSGGQKQRLFVALALINEPELVFLDEITTGLDPRARHSIWDLIRGIKDAGATVVLSTHFMDEAEALADRVAIMKSGRLVANDTPPNLIAGVRRREEVRLHIEGDVELSAIEAVEGVVGVESEPGGLTAHGGGRGWIARLVAAIDAQDAMLVDLSTRRPSLEDVYLQLTGEEEYETEVASTRFTSTEAASTETSSTEDGS
jgi:ABC-2 type transport system ATP-binding protein